MIHYNINSVSINIQRIYIAVITFTTYTNLNDHLVVGSHIYKIQHITLNNNLT